MRMIGHSHTVVLFIIFFFFYYLLCLTLRSTTLAIYTGKLVSLGYGASARVALEQSDYRRVLLCALDEFRKWELSVVVLVHLSEDLVRPLLGRRLVLRHLHHRADHLVDCLLSWQQKQTKCTILQWHVSLINMNSIFNPLSTRPHHIKMWSGTIILDKVF